MYDFSSVAVWAVYTAIAGLGGQLMQANITLRRVDSRGFESVVERTADQLSISHYEKEKAADVS